MPEGSHAVVVGPAGQISFDHISSGMEALGSSMGMVCADALKILARRHKATLMSLLKAPDMVEYHAWLTTVLQLWQSEQDIVRSAEAEVESDEGHATPSHAMPADTSQSAQSAQPSTHDDALHSSASLADAPFDTIVLSFKHFKSHQDEVEFEGASAADVVVKLQAVLDDVVIGEAHAAGVGAVEAGVLLEEWSEAHDIRQHRNTSAAHPLSNMRKAGQVLNLFEAATTAAHPVTEKIPHLAQQAALAGREHVAAVQLKALAKRSARGKLRG
eukprot:CAMPEP_0202867404 /NCGR_PEP_ID=MMETSP1391-20130828/9365_1 /ASSEMBLY_ACC=CAM_ASM_000867 /TAXON_ID=1034604 /ORGANISM="Chlamydomonas leiostraca, Strain SAG 11-49" /LENGTH=271 /DNA_ID=CAMNT_0049547447 /DNA_START=331 /DNA_END=1146 /DNA_ORIENTATION=+